MTLKVGGPAHGDWRDGGGLLGGAWGPSAFPGAEWVFSDGHTDPLLFSRWHRTFKRQGPDGASQEALEAPQPFHPMDLEPLQEGEVKQWPKDTVILLVWD